jgi:hypothetical protein
MNFDEALRLTHEERLKSADYGDRHLMKFNMNTRDRETLGALFHEFGSLRGSTVAQTWLTGISYCFETKVGKLIVHYSANCGTIYGRFENAKAASDILGRTAVNFYSGKWNMHTEKGDDPYLIFTHWKQQLERILP